MALFYPDIDLDELKEDETSGYRAERLVLKALKILDDKWRIFHGLDWRYIDEREGEKKGEADVIIFHPDLGILVIEVKSGGVEVKDGNWLYGSARLMKQSPFTQARRNRFAIYNRLKKTALASSILDFTAFTHTAWFPEIQWTGDIPMEVPHAGFILDERHLHNPEKQLRSILSDAFPNPISWTSQQVDILMRTLSPELNLMPPLGVVLGTIRDKLFRMTQKQITVLRALRKQKRLLVEGCAGCT